MSAGDDRPSTVERPWKRLSEAYPQKAELLRLMLREPLDRYAAKVARKVLPVSGLLAEAIKAYGTDVADLLLKWLDEDSQRCDQEFINAAERDLRDNLNKKISGQLRRVFRENSDELTWQYRAALAGAAMVARDKFLRILRLHAERQKVAAARFGNQIALADATIAQPVDSPPTKIKRGRRPTPPTPYYRKLYSLLKRANALKGRDSVMLGTKTLTRVTERLDKLKFPLPAGVDWVDDKPTWENALIFEEPKVKAYLAKVAKRVGKTLKSPHSVNSVTRR